MLSVGYLINVNVQLNFITIYKKCFQSHIYLFSSLPELSTGAQNKIPEIELGATEQ